MTKHVCNKDNNLELEKNLMIFINYANRIIIMTPHQMI